VKNIRNLIYCRSLQSFNIHYRASSR